MLGDTFKGLDLVAYNRERNRLAGVQVKSGTQNKSLKCHEFVVANMPEVDTFADGEKWLDEKIAPSDQKVFMLVVLGDDDRPSGTWYLVPSQIVLEQAKENREEWVSRYKKQPRLRKDGKGPVKDKGPQLFYATPKDEDPLYRNRFDPLDKILRA